MERDWKKRQITVFDVIKTLQTRQNVHHGSWNIDYIDVLYSVKASKKKYKNT